MSTLDRIDIDDRNDHPTIVFIQDRETRATVALDKDTGAIVGRAVIYAASGMPRELYTALEAYRREHYGPRLVIGREVS